MPHADTTIAQIPFWVQMLSISLAPIFGFAGVAIGAFISDRNQRRAYIRRTRQKVYQEYLEVLNQLLAYRHDMSRVAETQDLDAIREAASSSRWDSQGLRECLLKILLVGSPAAAQVAARVPNLEMLILALSLESGTAGFNEQKWEDLLWKIGEVRWSFTKIARRDLGLWGRHSALAAFEAGPDDLWKSDSDTVIESLSTTLYADERAKSADRPTDLPI